jgi:hypothetical protein
MKQRALQEQLHCRPDVRSFIAAASLLSGLSLGFTAAASLPLGPDLAGMPAASLPSEPRSGVAARSFIAAGSVEDQRIAIRCR